MDSPGTDGDFGFFLHDVILSKNAVRLQLVVRLRIFFAFSLAAPTEKTLYLIYSSFKPVYYQ